jgi:signal transduction histidine kinase
MPITAINIYLGIAAFFNFVLASVMFIKSPKTKANVYYSLAVFSTAFWTFCMMMFRAIDNESLQPWSIVLWLATIPIAYFFFYFGMNFPDGKKHSFFFHFLIAIPAIATFFLIIYPGILGKISYFNGYKGFIFKLPNFYYYSFFIIAYFFAGFAFLFRHYYQSTKIIKAQLTFVFIGTLISVMGGIIFGIFLPLIQNFTFYWLSPGLTIALTGFVAFAILKHHLFNIKVIATELLTFGIWIFLVIRLLLNQDLQGRIIDGVLLALVILFGILLIKGVTKEIEQKERLEKVTGQMEAANERLRQLDEAKSEFLSIASHQLRTPLTSIKGLLSMLQEEFWGPLNEEQKKYVGQISQSSERLLSLIEDLLNISRIEAGRMQFDFQPISLEDLVEDAVKELETQATHKNLSMKFSKPAQPLPKVNADSLKLRQVIQNLIDNAIKYTEKGGLEINVRQEGKDIIFSSKDTGMGLPPGQHLFEKFERGQKATNQHTEGLGLGLYLGDKIIKAHSGKIWAESEGEDKGSTFFFSLPIA